MHILFLTQIVPYPPNAGPRIKTWNVLRYLADRGHRISLATFVRSEEREYLPMLETVCAAVYPVPLQRSRIADLGYWLKSLSTGTPFLIERDNQAGMRAVVQQIVAAGDVDLIEADQLTMAQFALQARGKAAQPPVLFDSHNATFKIIERSLAGSHTLLRLPLALESGRLKRYEDELVRRCDHTLTVTELDRQVFLANSALSADDPRVSAIPIAVDTRQLPPVTLDPAAMNIVTLGTLTYPPNADGIRWFLREVFPLIHRQQPQTTLTIIGKKPPADFYTLAEPYGIAVTITGYVPDLTAYLERAAVMVVPVLAGSGMRVRILEAFSRGVPVVTTTIGLEGIHAGSAEVCVEDEPQPFANAVLTLIADPDLRIRMAQHARQLAETKYDWQVVLRAMDAVYANLLSPTGKLNEASS